MAVQPRLCPGLLLRGLARHPPCSVSPRSADGRLAAQMPPTACTSRAPPQAQSGRGRRGRRPWRSATQCVVRLEAAVHFEIFRSTQVPRVATALRATRPPGSPGPLRPDATMCALTGGFPPHGRTDTVGQQQALTRSTMSAPQGGAPFAASRPSRAKRAPKQKLEMSCPLPGSSFSRSRLRERVRLALLARAWPRQCRRSQAAQA